MARTWTIDSTVTLNGGVKMPVLGLGVWQTAAGAATRTAVRAALDAGYRLLDTARVYQNEADVGAALRESGLPRAEVFVTTKLWNSDHGYDRTLRACDQSLARLGLTHVDLYLVHWPAPGRRETWRAMERLLADGKARAIGVSNYTIRHLDELLGECRIAPSVNQVEFHPFLHQRELLEHCRAHRIQLEAYGPLVRGQRMDHPAIVQVARKHGRTPAQVLVRWGIEHGVVTIPKSARPERIRENADVFGFALDAEDLAALDGLDEGYRTAWDPTGAE
ncbi:MAG TPA: aldo/keto reductase [Anaeromyxobacter sp.]|nr:aldo/keto reductase [Anaeromyxobacter sp.]